MYLTISRNYPYDYKLYEVADVFIMSFFQIEFVKLCDYLVHGEYWLMLM